MLWPCNVNMKKPTESSFLGFLFCWAVRYRRHQGGSYSIYSPPRSLSLPRRCWLVSNTLYFLPLLQVFVSLSSFFVLSFCTLFISVSVRVCALAALLSLIMCSDRLWPRVPQWCLSRTEDQPSWTWEKWGCHSGGALRSPPRQQSG